jgi:phenylalanyl-tRNA synthetase alpha chain
MREDLKALREQAESELLKAKTEEELQEIRTRYLGRKGLLTGLLRNIKNVPSEERSQFGRQCNEVKETLFAGIDQLLAGLASSKKEEILQRERLDVSLPGRGVRHGRLHPVTQVREEICRIFAGLGFSVVEGPEVELDYYNFEALNIPKDHPARDMQDTFYVEDNIVLRTHTSPVQVRIMEKRKPPVRILSPGRVYRRDSDISHTPMFHQIEGLLVDRGITFGDLKGVLTVFLKQVFGEDTALRFRPSFLSGASCAAVGVAGSAVRAAGWRSWDPAWSIPRCSRTSVMIPKNSQVLPLVSVWRGSPC